jgi:hypothetical protein
MSDDELPKTRAPDLPKANKKAFSKRRPNLSALIAPVDTDRKLSEVVEVKDRDKPDTIAPEHIERLMSDMDTNNNGFVERDEFRMYIRRKGWPVSDEKADQMFDEANTNGDGRLDFRELQGAASGKFKRRIHKNEWFTFLSQVAEQLSGAQNVFELPVDPSLQVPIEDAADMAPNVLTFRPARFTNGEVTPGSADSRLPRGAKARTFVVAGKPSARPDAAVAIATLDSFDDAGGSSIREANLAAVEKAINHKMLSKVVMSDRAEVRALFAAAQSPPGAEPRRAFDMSAALGRSMAPLLGSHYAVSFESNAAFDTALRGIHERSERTGTWPTAREPRDAASARLGAPPPPRPLLEQVEATRPKPASVTRQHYVPSTRDTLVLRPSGLISGGIDGERGWVAGRLATNEGLTPSLFELDAARGREEAAEARAARLAHEAAAFSTTSLLHKPLQPPELRARDARAVRAGGDVDSVLPASAVGDSMNGKPAAHVFRDEPARSGRTLLDGRPDFDLVSRVRHAGAAALSAHGGGAASGRAQRAIDTENDQPSAAVKARSGLIGGQWAEGGRLPPAAAALHASRTLGQTKSLRAGYH